MSVTTDLVSRIGVAMLVLFAALTIGVGALMLRLTRGRAVHLRSLVVHHWLTLVGVVCWVGVAVVAGHTNRVPQFLSTSLAAVGILGITRAVAYLGDAARASERELAAEIAESIHPSAQVSPMERRFHEDIQQRIARAIRGQGAHLSKGGPRG